jgi:hypothetical protein
MLKNVDPVGLRIARLAYVMNSRPHPATITYNAKASVLAARQHALQNSRDAMDCDPPYERMAANSARVSGPMHLSCTAKHRSSVLYGQVK